MSVSCRPSYIQGEIAVSKTEDRSERGISAEASVIKVSAALTQISCSHTTTFSFIHSACLTGCFVPPCCCQCDQFAL